MYKLHDEFMPEDMQAELLANFGGPRSLSIFHTAHEWFGDLVKRVARVEPAYKTDLQRYEGKPNGYTANSDIHPDTNVLGDTQKYVLIVSNNPFASTLFFNTDSPEELEGRRSGELLYRDGDNGLVVREHGLQLNWDQAIVGQLSSFDYGGQLHAAAPLDEGDMKILFNSNLYK